MSTVIVLFTRDLRVHDHPALMAACADADRVVPLFVFDDHVYGHAIASPNKMAFLLDSVDDLAARLRDLGGALYKAAGTPGRAGRRRGRGSRRGRRVSQ